MRPWHLIGAFLAAGLAPGLQAAVVDGVPPVGVAPWAGTLGLVVDATNVEQRIFRVRETVPVTPGPLTLLYPQWIPGHHSPTGPIDKFAGLVVRGGGERLPWLRDKYNVYAFHVEVPAGVHELELEFQYLSPQDRREGRIVMTPAMLNLQWDAMSLYPAGHAAGGIAIRASVILPPGWSYATALGESARDGDRVDFEPVSYEVLVDSPLFAGRHHKRVDLDPGAKRPVWFDVFADAPEELEMSVPQVQAHRNLVRQMDRLYGARHFDRYHLMLAISSQMSGIGLEHHRSSENGVGLGYFRKWDSQWAGRDLLAHEYNHSWNGKYRRGADLATPNFNVPMGDSLMWLYEGQTQFYGNVVAVRAGLLSLEQGLDKLALVAATYDRGRPGMTWRNIQDTTNDPVIARRAPRPFRNWQMSEDYYSGGQLIWLAVDGKLRELTRGRRSLDDFARAFFGMDDGSWEVNTYTFEDVVAALEGIAPHDWAGFLRERLDGHVNLADALASQGWRLVYTDQPSPAVEAMERWRDSAMLIWSLGLSANDKGEISDVLWDGPAFNAGLAPGMKLVAVNDRQYSAAVLKDAIREAATPGHAEPIRLLVRNFDRYRTIAVDYHGGLRHPHLERIEGRPDFLSRLHAPR